MKANYSKLGEDFSLQKLTRFLPERQRSHFQSLLSDRYRLLAATFDQKIPLEPPLDNIILGIRQLFYQDSPNWLGILFSIQKTDRPQYEVKPAPPLSPTDFEQLEQSQNIGFWQFDLQNWQVHFSNAIYHIPGYEPEELIGQHHTIIHPKAVREQVNNAYRKGIKPGPLQIIPLRTKEGGIIETQPSETVIEYNGVRAKLGIFSDKTKLVKAEQKAEHRKRQYQQLVKYSSDLITISNGDLTVQWASNNTKAILGYAKSELQGSKLLDLIHPEDLKPATDLILDALQEDEPEFSYTARFRHKDNSYRWLQNHIIRTTDDTGQPIGITYSRDITAQKELQEKKAEMDRPKQEFVSMASHQLRTPMAVFAANLEMLAETEAAQSTMMKRILTRMERESTRMVRLVDDVLAVSKLNTEEELQVNKTPIEIVSFLREILADEAFYFDEAPIALHTELQQGNIEADEEQLTHILRNLLSNAIKYSERRAPPPEVHVRQTAAGKIQVDLKDHGVGIPEADLPKLFQQFYRGDNVKNIVGTGLGLYVVKRFAELNDIRVEVRSKLKQGTVFTLTFKPV